MWKLRFDLQRAEWCGSDNRYYCGLSLGKAVNDEATLFCYYVHSGGAADFARRWEEANSELNRYYCSLFYKRNVQDIETLWKYYMANSGKRPGPSGASCRCDC